MAESAPARIALLGAVNVGGHAKIGMAALSAMATDIGLGTPRTLLQSAVSQAVQRWMWCGRPLSVFIGKAAVSPVTAIRSASMMALRTKAVPVWRWQSRQ
jgi:hypothetical protein